MEAFFLQFLLAGEEVITLTGIVLFFGGAILGLLFLKPTFRLRRVSYIWLLVIANLIITISSSLALLSAQAIAAGMLSVLILFIGFCFFGAGMLIAFGSLARANDAYGKRSKGWMGIVPIVCLALWLSPPHEGVGSVPAPRSKFSRYILDPVLVIVALAAMGMMNLFIDQLEDIPASAPELDASTSERVLRAMSVEQIFRDTAREMQPQLPMRVDQITILTAVSADGNSLFFDYSVEQQIDLPNDFENGLRENICSPDVFGTAIERGGRFISTYVGPDGNQIAAFVISQCP
ncbi:UNVERIFIED_ORG: hypothetical protein BCL66_102265 [Martelella mediterranea]